MTTTARLRWIIAIACATLLAACSDHVGPPSPSVIEPPTGLFVSNPIAVGTAATRSTLSAALSASLFVGDSVVYVALTPGSVPTGSRATVHRVGDADSLFTPVIGGGFDPVPVPADVGDSIEVVVTDAGGAPVQSMQLAVAAIRPPIVVRTQPPPHKRDQPLNAALVMVFSEPVAGATVNPASVQLFHGSTSVPGSVSLLQGTASAAVFTPTTSLDANADYRLVVRQTVRDLTGDALPSEMSVDFTTGTTVLGPVASVSIAGLYSDSGVVVSLGSRVQLPAIAFDAQGHVIPGQPVLWSSSTPAVASVSATGLVSALAEGSALIRAEVDGVVGEITVFVKAGLPPIGSVTVTPESTRIAVGGTLLLTAVSKDTAGRVQYSRVVTWTTTNEAAATVTPVNGASADVKGVGAGIAQIVATVEGKSDTAVVAVGPPRTIFSLVLSPNSPTVVLQAHMQLEALGRDDQGFLNVIDSTLVTWSSSDPTVASVDNAGLVTGLQAGSATITGTWSGHQATASVTVAALAFSMISASGWHACGLTLDSTAFCWGDGYSGELGIGSVDYGTGAFPDTVSVPTAVAGGLRFSTLSVSGSGSCGLATAGKAYCWGWAGLQYGPPNLTPVAVPGGLTFTALSVGGSGGFVCALDSDGLAHCWGVNWAGYFGTGDTIGSATPRLAAGGMKFKAITSGGSHACGLTPAGEVYCWGLNFFGQLGTGDTVASLVPRKVAGGFTFAAISAAETHTCALDVNGAVYCWGISDWHQSGGSPTPVPVLSGVTFTSISSTANAVSTCGLDLSGTVQCWIDWGAPSSWTPWTVSGGPFVVLSKGYNHACAVTAEHVGYCWGYGQDGQLGNGTTTDSAVPVKVLGQP